MKSQTIKKSLKTASIVFTTDLICALLANPEQGVIAVLMTTATLLYAFQDRRPNTIEHDNRFFKREPDGHYYTRENGNDPERLETKILEERKQIQYMPDRIIENGAALFDYLMPINRGFSNS